MFDDLDIFARDLLLFDNEPVVREADLDEPTDNILSGASMNDDALEMAPAFRTRRRPLPRAPVKDAKHRSRKPRHG